MCSLAVASVLLSTPATLVIRLRLTRMAVPSLVMVTVLSAADCTEYSLFMRHNSLGFLSVTVFAKPSLSRKQVRNLTLWALHFPWQAVDVYLVTRLHFYTKSGLLVKVLLVPFLRNGLIVLGLFRGIANPRNSSPLVLYGA